MEWKPGDTAVCAGCGREIVFIGPHWDHPGEIKPRHPALPKLPVAKTWLDEFEGREQKEIDLARLYAAQYDHGSPGHLHLKIIAKMAALLDRELLYAAMEYTIERHMVDRHD